jgi:molybdopterin converting factor small subunit
VRLRIVRVQVRYYHRIRDLAGDVSETVEVDDGATVGDLLTRLGALRLQMAPDLATALVARNEEYSDRRALLVEGDVIDIMPPVCGG